MKVEKCTKRYPRDLHAETITRNYGCPQYRRRSTEDSDKFSTFKMRNNDIQVLPSKSFKAHTNVEHCNSVRSIKYIYKNVNKRSDMAVLEWEIQLQQLMKSKDIN